MIVESMVVMRMPRNRFARPVERRKRGHVCRVRRALHMHGPLTAVTNRIDRLPVARESRQYFFTLTQHNHIRAELLQCRPRRGGRMRPDYHDPGAQTADDIDCFQRDSQFRRCTAPEQITRSRCDDSEIGTELLHARAHITQRQLFELRIHDLNFVPRLFQQRLRKPVLNWQVRFTAPEVNASVEIPRRVNEGVPHVSLHPP
jgi:hypothetical protein